MADLKARALFDRIRSTASLRRPRAKSHLSATDVEVKDYTLVSTAASPDARDTSPYRYVVGAPERIDGPHALLGESKRHDRGR